jgi:hypothetical protein
LRKEKIGGEQKRDRKCYKEKDNEKEVLGVRVIGEERERENERVKKRKKTIEEKKEKET